LCAAVRSGALTAEQARAFLRAAAAIHYVDRDWPAILAGCDHEPDALSDWVAVGAVARKQLDAVLCLEAALTGGAAPRPRPLFERTLFIDALAGELGIDLSD
jgi:hypothetical protein